MIRLVIEVDDHPSWAECTKEAVAERLSDLGGVRVVECKVDKHRSATRRPAAGLGAARTAKTGWAEPSGILPREAKEPATSGPNGSVTSQQTTMTGYGPQALNKACPHCGARVVMVRGPEGTAVMREVLPKSFWPDPSGPETVMGIDEKWQRGRLEGDSNVKHTVGFPIHKCDP